MFEQKENRVRMSWLAVGFVSAVFTQLAVAPAMAAEISIKPQAKCGHVILLGDIAEIFGGPEDEIARLKAVELGPAPRAGQTERLTVQQIQTALWRRNIDYVSHRFTGASRVEVQSSVEEPRRFESAAVSVPLNANRREAAQQALSQTIASFLKRYVDEQTDWRVQASLTDDELDAYLLTGGWEISLAPRRPYPGEVDVWLGQQQFTLEAASSGVRTAADTQPRRLNIDVRVDLPPTIVTLRYGVREGTILTANHLNVIPADEDQRLFHAEPLSLAEVIGKEVTRTANEGSIIDRSMIRGQRLVKKGDTVTVIASSGGIRVRALGKAMDDGGEGDLVNVQSEFQKQFFTARVVGPQTVEVNLNPATPAVSGSGQHMQTRLPAARGPGNPNNALREPPRPFPIGGTGVGTTSATGTSRGGANSASSLSRVNSNNQGGNQRSNQAASVRWRQGNQ